jgi:homoserine acetyltransferase
MKLTQQQQDFNYKVEQLKANAQKVQDLVAHYEELQNVKTHWGFNGDLYRINALLNQILNEEK